MSRRDAGSRGRGRREGGFTLIETVVLFTVMSLGLFAGLSLLNGATSHSEAATAEFLTEDRARGALAGVFDILTETSSKYVDTAMRVHGPGGINDVFTDRFTIPGATLRQCTSPTCSFHTRDDLSVVPTRLQCGFEYCVGLLGTPVTRGKTWPATFTACPLDGSSLSTIARLDGVKFFVARDVNGAFTKLPDGRPRWSGLVFFFPCVSPNGLCELRRYDVYVSDLLATPPTHSAGWNRFDPLNPTMIDLFDFGKDGTLNGVPDKKVPLTNLLSDARNEAFTAGTVMGEPTILVTKLLPGASAMSYPQRTLTLSINLLTGETQFAVDHHDSATAYWSASCEFTRTPRTLVQSMTELAISTSLSSPFNATANPTGVADQRVVRITLGTSDSPRDRRTSWVHHIENFQIKTRN